MQSKLIIALIFIASMAALSCHKIDHGTISTKSCRPIKVFNQDSNLVAEFSYYDWGGPKLVKRQETGTGEYEYIFYYNNQRQLIGFREGIFREKDTGTNLYTKYIYDGKVIVGDSMFSGSYLDDPLNEEYHISKYSYDNFGRITEYSMRSSNGDYSDTIRFTYPRENPFHDNHSIFAGNKILMFVNKDYHRTNPGVTRYNANGYPESFSPWLNGRLVYGYRFHSIVISHVIYECSY